MRRTSPAPFHRLLLPAPFLSLPNTVPCYPRWGAVAVWSQGSAAKNKRRTGFFCELENGLDWDCASVPYNFPGWITEALDETVALELGTVLFRRQKWGKEEKEIYESYLRVIIWVSLLAAAVTFQVYDSPSKTHFPNWLYISFCIPVFVLFFRGWDRSSSGATQGQYSPTSLLLRLNFLAFLRFPLPLPQNFND